MAPTAQREIRFKAVPLEVKVDAERRRIEGYAATFGNVDNGGDVIVAGAFRKTVSERFPRKLIKFLIDHFIPVGMPVEMAEDPIGLYTVSEVAKSATGDEFLANYGIGLYSHLSIGYVPIIEEEDRSKNVRFLREVKLLEYSAVLWPMNEQAVILGAKSFQAHVDRLQQRFDSLAGRPPVVVAADLSALGKSIADLSASVTKALGMSAPDSVAAIAASVATSGNAQATQGHEPPPESVSPEMYQLLHDGLLDLRRKAQAVS